MPDICGFKSLGSNDPPCPKPIVINLVSGKGRCADHAGDAYKKWLVTRDSKKWKPNLCGSCGGETEIKQVNISDKPSAVCIKCNMAWDVMEPKNG